MQLYSQSNMIQSIRQYYIDEQSGAVRALLVAILVLTIALLLRLKFRTHPFVKGLTTGLLVVSILLLGLGMGSFVYNNRRIANTAKLPRQSEQVLQKQELARMGRVINVTFPAAFLAFAVLLLVALLVIRLAANPYWKGIGSALLLLVILLIISDSFSWQRNKAYGQKIAHVQAHG